MQNEPSQSSPDDRTKNITIGIGSLTIQNIVTSGLSFVFLAVLIRLVPFVDYTGYSSILVSIGVGITISTFSLQYAAARYVALLEKDETRLWAAARAIIILSLIFAVATTTISISNN